jgi:hypothetical protein
MKAIPHISIGKSGVAQVLLETSSQGTPGTPSEGEGCTETTSSMNIYVATTGNDVTGDGTASKPYATITKAESEVPYLLKHAVQIHIAAGTYSVFPSVVNHQCIDNGQLVFDGVDGIAADSGPFTLTGVDATESYGGFKYLTVAGAGWTPNEFRGKFIRMTSGAALNGIGYIWKNSADTVSIVSSYYQTISVGETFVIGDPEVTVNIPSGNKTRISVVDMNYPDPCVRGQDIKSRLGLGYISFIGAGPDGVGIYDTVAALHGCVFKAGTGAAGDYSLILSNSHINYTDAFNAAKFFTLSDFATSLYHFICGIQTSSLEYFGVVFTCGFCVENSIDLFRSRGGYSLFSMINYLMLLDASIDVSYGHFERYDTTKNSVEVYDSSFLRIAYCEFFGGKNMVVAEASQIWGSINGDSANYSEYGLKSNGEVRHSFQTPCTGGGTLGDIYFEMSDTVESWPNLYRHAVSDGKGSFVLKNSALGD